MKLIIPIILGTTINQIYTIVIRIVASKLGEGNISAFDYASRISSLVFSIVIFSISTVIFSELSSVAHEYEEYKDILVKTIRIVLIIIIPLMILLVILKEQIVGIVFQHGIFAYNDTLLVSKVFFWLILGLIGMSIREILYKALYALKDTKTPLVIGTVYLFLCIFFIIILSKIYGIQGVAISISATSTLNVLSLLVIFKKRYNIDLLKDFITIILKTGVISIVFIICVFILSKFNILDLHGQHSFLQNVFVSIKTGFLFIFIYSIGFYLLKLDEICKLVDIMKIRSKKRGEKIL
jgi:putative peptidoglycan lipid II flippase